MFTGVSLGPNDACAINTAGSAVCWGSGYSYIRNLVDSILGRDPEADLDGLGFAQLLPPDRTDLLEIVVHPWRHYACARTGQGEIACWGRPPPDSPAPPGGDVVDLISTGRGFCALDSEGRTDCWGELQLDQFISDAGPFTQIAASGGGLCGITAEGEVRCRVPDSPTAPGPPVPYSQVFRNVHVIGSQGCGVLEDGTLHCRQTHHWCSYYFSPDVEYCPADQIRFQSWDIPFTILYEGGPNRETTAQHHYSRLFGDQAACAVTTEAHILCWSDFRSGDPRHDVPARFRPQPSPEDPEPAVDEDESES